MSNVPSKWRQHNTDLESNFVLGKPEANAMYAIMCLFLDRGKGHNSLGAKVAQVDLESLGALTRESGLGVVNVVEWLPGGRR